MKSVDIATVYDISYYASAPLRQVIPIACQHNNDKDIYVQFDVKKLTALMKLDIPETTCWKSFSSVVLRPLRYQMMGSVLVRISNYLCSLYSFITVIILYYTIVQACNLAMEKGWAINIGGGFGHYTTNIGGGLAVYDDVLVCLAVS